MFFIIEVCRGTSSHTVLKVCLHAGTCYTLSLWLCWSFAAYLIVAVTPSLLGGVSLPARVNEGGQSFIHSRLHTCFLNGSFRLLISHQGISAHIIPLGISFSRQEANGKAACVYGQSTFEKLKALAAYLQISGFEIPFPEEQ